MTTTPSAVVGVRDPSVEDTVRSPQPAVRSAGGPHPAVRSGFQVRQATIADLDVVVSLRLALVREHGSNPIYRRIRPDAPERARSLYTAQLNSDHEAIFLAMRSGIAVGILRIVESAGSIILDPPRYGYLSSVYVAPSARRRGILKLLMSAAEKWCEERGLDEMRLHSASDNPQSNATWDALGFGVVEHVRLRSLRK